LLRKNVDKIHYISKNVLIEFMPSNTLSAIKSDSKPNVMRYQRVQAILENEPGMRKRLGPKDCVAIAKFGEQVSVSKLTLTVTESLHEAGRDSSKIPKSEIVDIAASFLPEFNPDAARPSPVVPGPDASPAQAPVLTCADRSILVEPKPKKLNINMEIRSSGAVILPESTDSTASAVKMPTLKRAPKATPEPEQAPVKIKMPKSRDGELPENELPPEKQPVRLPKNYDPSKYPHFSIQTSIYSLLLSAMSMSETHERCPGAEIRQQKLESLITDYLQTVDQIKSR
jgi:hypothetical protein